MVYVSEGMLCVELKLVIFKRGELIDQLVERLNLGDFATADVEHVAADLQIRLVVYEHARQGIGFVLNDLLERA